MAKRSTARQLSLWDDGIPTPGEQPAEPEPIDLMKALVARIHEDGDPWRAWVQRPRTKEQRLQDLTLQIRRDMAVLQEPKEYHPDDSFYERRIAGCREEANALAEELGL